MKNYQLSDQDRIAWYKTTISPLFLEGKQPSKTPTFVLLTGQSGAGKTTASFKYAQQTSPEPAKFGGDDLRILLPYAAELLQKNPNEYPFITKADMSWARERLVDECIENNFNIQIDSILSNSNDWRMGTIMKAKQAGYRIECVALGVHRYLSEVSMFARREEQIKSLGVGFPVTMADHDKAYDILPCVVSKMYKEGIADRVSVYNRMFDKYYDTNTRANTTEQDIMKAIMRSREDYLNKESLTYINALWENIYEDMARRNATEEQLKEVSTYHNAFRKSSGIYLVDSNIKTALINNTGKNSR